MTYQLSSFEVYPEIRIHTLDEAAWISHSAGALEKVKDWKENYTIKLNNLL